MPCCNARNFLVTTHTTNILHHHDTIGDWRYLSLADCDLGRPAGVLQSGSVRGQRMPAGTSSAADTATALRTVRCGLATRRAVDNYLPSQFPPKEENPRHNL